MKKVLCGNEMDKMPDVAFRMMSLLFRIADLFRSPAHRLDTFGIQKETVVMDYGCGTGRYLKQASELTGPGGLVYAVDIHPLAIESAYRVIRKEGLANVKPMLTDGKRLDIPTDSVDLVYALDMFHMVSDPEGFLTLLHQITKKGGTLILEDGHQPRSQTRQKVLHSGLWEIRGETRYFLSCEPKGK